MIDQSAKETLGIVGGGAIATGLAATAVEHGLKVKVWARSPEKVGPKLEKTCSRVGHPAPPVTSDFADLADCTFVCEAVAEDTATKCQCFEQLAPHLSEDAVLATTTSSLSITELANRSGRPDRFAGLHVFNPVTKMALIELVFPEGATDDVRGRTRALAQAIGKTAVEVPDTPGFVVNRLLFPYLFEAVKLQERTGLSSEDLDRCMTLGAGHPMGPLALLDLVGLDVSAAIGRMIGVDVPPRVDAMIEEGALGRKAGRGFHPY